MHTDKPATRKTIVLLVILGLGSFVSLLVGLLWDAVLYAHAADLARTENAFNLINPDHISLTNGIVAGFLGLGHFLLVFGIVAILVSLLGATYTYLQLSGPRWRASRFRRISVIGVSALVLLVVGTTTWAASAISYESMLAAEPPAPSTSSTGEKVKSADCTAPPTPEQQEAANKLVADTKATVAKYTDLSKAKADGYQPSSPTWQPVTHYINPAYQRDKKLLDPDRPEALVYANTSKGSILLGAMYLMPDPDVSGPQIGGCLTQWHAHSLLGWETPEMLHVWTVDLSGGPFSEQGLRPFVQSLENSS